MTDINKTIVLRMIVFQVHILKQLTYTECKAPDL